jgi:alkylation response protein AidB-like acyl-CoA dehydrogenase
VDFSLSPEQHELTRAVSTLLTRFAGTARARMLETADAHDDALMTALMEAGFCDLEAGGAGPLEAVLVTEAVAAAAGRVLVGARSLVAPAVLSDPLPAVICLQGEDEDAPLRFGAHADVVIGCDSERAWTVDPTTASVVPVPGSTVFPLAIVSGGVRQALDVAPETVLAWWRIALAAEMVGAMDSALSLTVEHLSARHQFGRPLSSFQALRHRLAEVHVSIEGARWLVRCAAYNGAEPVQASAAIAAATAAAKSVIDETHQMSGAMGMTMEYDLHLWTRRLIALRQECGGADRHAESLARSRWLASASELQHSRIST